MNENQPETVTASEIGEYVYDPQLWRDRLIGKAKADRAVLDAGTRLHARKERAVHASTGFTAVGRLLIFATLIALAIMWMRGR